MKLIAFFAFALLAKDKICKALRFRKLTQILFFWPICESNTQPAA